MQEIIQVEKVKKQRCWEVDALRGLLILFVVWDHLMYDLGYMFKFNSEFMQQVIVFAKQYRVGILRTTTHSTFIVAFVVISGVSTSFSHNNLSRGIRLGLFAIALTIVTRVASIYVGGGIVITFGIIHMLACCVLVGFLLKKIRMPSWAMALIALVLILVGSICFNAPAEATKGDWWYWLVKTTVSAKMSPGDFQPLLPYLGWFIFGVLFGQSHYANKQSLVKVNVAKYFAPFSYIGKNTLLIYFGSQIVAILLLQLLFMAGC